MTHDELLAKINVKIKCGSSEVFKLYRALRAVVELHKPHDKQVATTFVVSESLHHIIREPYCELDNTAFPCPTIQAIEKELK